MHPHLNVCQHIYHDAYIARLSPHNGDALRERDTGYEREIRRLMRERGERERERERKRTREREKEREKEKEAAGRADANG